MLAPPRDLTIPEPGSTTARGILSLALSRVLRELASIRRLAIGAAPDEVAAIERLVSTAPKGALASALRRPTVSAPLRCLRKAAPEAREGLVIEVLGQLAFDLAVNGALPEPLTLRRWPTRFLSISSRVSATIVDGPHAIILANGPRAGLGEEAIVEHPFHDLLGPAFAAHDNNPLALVEAHPDKAGNAVDLGGHAAEEWVRELRAALASIAQTLPDLRAELDLFVAQIVPVGWDAEKHLSASYQEAIGTVYMTLHPSRMTLIEAVMHEGSHNKLNALFEIDDVLENAWSPLYASPVRPDPRPLHGVLLAVHAFLPVARFYERLAETNQVLSRRADFQARFEEIRRINREGAALLLEHARPTRVGAGVLEEIRRWDEHFR